jgi:hypothetical protein
VDLSGLGAAVFVQKGNFEWNQSHPGWHSIGFPTVWTGKTATAWICPCIEVPTLGNHVALISGLNVAIAYAIQRNHRWNWLGVQKETEKEISVAFGLKPENIPASFREQWPYGIIDTFCHFLY